MHNYDLGNRLYELRKAKGLSQKELGELLGVSNKSVSKWENGTAIPKTDTLVKLAGIFNVSTEELLQGKTNDIITLSQLSAQTNELLLSEEIKKRDREDEKKQLANQKKYLVAVFSLFVSIFAVFIIFNVNVDYTLDQEPIWYETIFIAVALAYVVSSILSGIVFTIRVVKKLPAWVLIIFCIFFPITILSIEMTGLIITPTYVITSVKAIIKDKKNG